MTIDYDHDADAIYITLRPGLQYAYGEDLDDSRRVDYGIDGQPIGIELLQVSSGIKVDDLPEQLAIQGLLQQYGLRLVAQKA
jgi:uncharacterized protein YuzE